MVRQPGAVRMTRRERAPHSGQADGRSHSAIARNCVNGPHFLHIYSYVGIDHLHPAKTHPAADQSVAIMETIPVDSWAVNVIGHQGGKRVVRLLEELRSREAGGRAAILFFPSQNFLAPGPVGSPPSEVAAIQRPSGLPARRTRHPVLTGLTRATLL